VLELVVLLREISGVERFEPSFAPARLGELARSCLDITRAREELGWAPTVSIREGLRLTLEAGRSAAPR
jgi:UDP-glucose 4-epimerase